MVAVPTMLTDAAEIDELLEALEVRFLANRDAHLAFALLTDFRDAAERDAATATTALLAARAATASRRSTRRYAAPGDGARGRSSCSTAPRRWNPREGVWMGWERKRGKLEEFNAALRGDASRVRHDRRRRSSGCTACGTSSRSTATRSCRATRRAQLVGTLAHPLNRPSSTQRSAASPRATDPPAARRHQHAERARARASRACSPASPASIRTRAPSPTSTRTCSAKARSSARASTTSTRFAAGDRRPLPGEPRPQPRPARRRVRARRPGQRRACSSRTIPSTYPADVSRRHRWIRGDWQIAPWLLPRVPGRRRAPRRATRSRALSQWKILDNLRRSLVPIALLALLLRRLVRRRRGGAAATLVVLGDPARCPALLVGGRRRSRAGRPTCRAASTRARSPRRSARQLVREAFALACLPYDAFVSVDAIVRTLARVLDHAAQAARVADRQRRAARARGRACAGSYASMWIAAGDRGRGRGRRSCCSDRRALWPAAPVLALWLRRAGARVVAEPAARAAARRGSPPSDRAFLRTRRAADLALLRDVRRRRRQLPAARQLPGRSAARRRAPHLADQHRPGAARQPGRVRLRLHHGRRGDRRARRARSRRSTSCSATAATSSTGTTRARSSRCARCTSRPSTAATSPATCSRSPPGCDELADAADRRARRSSPGSRDTLDVLRRGARQPAELDGRVACAASLHGRPTHAGRLRSSCCERLCSRGRELVRTADARRDARAHLVGARACEAQCRSARSTELHAPGAVGRASAAPPRATLDMPASSRVAQLDAVPTRSPQTRAARDDARCPRSTARSPHGDGRDASPAAARGWLTALRARVDRGRRARQRARQRAARSSRPAAPSWPTSTTSSSTTATATCSRSASTSATTGSTPASTTCSPPRRASPASSRSRRASCRRSTGSASAGC